MTDINKKSFITVLRNSKSFTVSVFGFSITASLFSNIVAKVRVVTTMIIGLGLRVSLVIKRVRFTFNNALIKLYTKLVLSLNLRKIGLTISAMKLTTKWIQSIGTKRVILGLLMKMRLRITDSLIKVSKITLGLLPLVGSFTKLSVFDPQMLVALDSTTLQNMDVTYTP
jgi:hypothetical protein